MDVAPLCATPPPARQTPQRDVPVLGRRRHRAGPAGAPKPKRDDGALVYNVQAVYSFERTDEEGQQVVEAT
jgi:hypothetical protein